MHFWFWWTKWSLSAWLNLALFFWGLWSEHSLSRYSLSTELINLEHSHLLVDVYMLFICPRLTGCTISHAYGPVFLINKWCVEWEFQLLRKD
jgi:hypothetical protein